MTTPTDLPPGTLDIRLLRELTADARPDEITAAREALRMLRLPAADHTRVHLALASLGWPRTTPAGEDA